MIRIKAPKAAPDFKSPSRHANGRIFDICVRWRNAGGGLKDKQMGVFILITKSCPSNLRDCEYCKFFYNA